MIERKYEVYQDGICDGRPGFKVTNGRDSLCFINNGEGPGTYWGPCDEAWTTDRKSEADSVVADLINGEGTPNYPPQNYRKREVKVCRKRGR
jgi:hypothetical protein